MSNGGAHKQDSEMFDSVRCGRFLASLENYYLLFFINLLLYRFISCNSLTRVVQKISNLPAYLIETYRLHHRIIIYYEITHQMHIGMFQYEFYIIKREL